MWQDGVAATPQETMKNLDSMKHEASMLAELRHPNIVQFLGVCLDPECPQMIMEHVACVSMCSRRVYPCAPGVRIPVLLNLPHGRRSIYASTCLAVFYRAYIFMLTRAFLLRMDVCRGGELSVTDARNEHQKLHIIRDVAAGLLYLHKQSTPILHLDLKCQNVLLDSVGTAKLADFGISLIAGLHFGALPGTPLYSAPEVASVL